MIGTNHACFHCRIGSETFIVANEEINFTLFNEIINFGFTIKMNVVYVISFILFNVLYLRVVDFFNCLYYILTEV